MINVLVQIMNTTRTITISYYVTNLFRFMSWHQVFDLMLLIMLVLLLLIFPSQRSYSDSGIIHMLDSPAVNWVGRSAGQWIPQRFIFLSNRFA